MTGTDENILQEDTRAIINSLAHTKDVRIVVFGDYALDKYLYSDPENDEISAETGKMYSASTKRRSWQVLGEPSRIICVHSALRFAVSV